MSYYYRVGLTIVLVLVISIFAIAYAKIELYLQSKFKKTVSSRSIFWVKLILILVLELSMVLFISNNIQWGLVDTWFMCSFLLLALVWIGTASRSSNNRSTKQFAKFLGAEINEEIPSEKVITPPTNTIAIGTYVFGGIGIVFSFIYYL